MIWKKMLVLLFAFALMESLVGVGAFKLKPISVSITPLSASINLGESVIFTSTVTGGYKPDWKRSFQWFMNSVPVSTLENFTFTPEIDGVFMVFLEVTDQKGQVGTSELAIVTVTEILPPQPKIVTLISNIAWFYYSDMTVRWNAHGLTGSFLVDLDGNHNTVALSWAIWISTYGDAVDVGTRSYSSGVWSYVWGPRIGEYKIDVPPYEWYLRASTDSEWFGYTLNKTTLPTDYIVKLHASDGTSLKSITSTFWYTSDSGESWHSFTP